MASKPVKVLADLLTRKQIIKQDADGNVLFRVTGSLESGYILSVIPITASAGINGRLYGTASYALNAATASYAENAGGGITSVYTSGNISGSGLEENPIFLKDPLIIGTITSSYIYSPQITGSLHGTASYAENAGNINLSGIYNAYNRLRYQTTGNFDIDGNVTIILPTQSFGSNAFPVNSMDFINVTVMVKQENIWTNDILSVQMYTSSNHVYIDLYAPSLTNTDEYKLIAVNENPADYMVV